MKLTPFGLYVRKLRLELGLTLKAMATDLSITSAYLSAIELGEKALTKKIADQTMTFFQGKISDQQFTELQSACDESMKTIAVSSLALDERSLVAAFARRISEGQGVPKDVLRWINSGGSNSGHNGKE